MCHRHAASNNHKVKKPTSRWAFLLEVNMNPILIYITTSNQEEAKTLSKILLDKKLIACSNILSQMNSFYSWEGKIESSQECILLLKSFQEKYRSIEEVVLANHSYEIPCLITLKLESVNKAYLDWMKSQVQ